MAGNDDLHPLLKNINETIRQLRGDVQSLTGEVKKIPEILKQGFANLRDAIHESIQAQAELKMMEHMMEVTAVKPQIEAERDQIQNVRAELDERMEAIGERYEQKHEELDEEAEKRIRELGSHIFGIEEDEFGDGIEEPFTNQVTPVWRNLQASNETIRDTRESRVVDTTDSVAAEIDSFLERKQQLIEQIDDHLLSTDAVPASLSDQTDVQFPYYVVEYELDGATERAVVPPSEVSVGEDSDSWSAAVLDPIPGSETLVSDDRQLDRSTASTERLDREAIAGILDEHGTTSRLGPTYIDAIDESLTGDVTVTVEGGAD